MSQADGDYFTNSSATQSMALGTEEASQEPFPDKDKALYEQIKPRLFFVGPPKSGKTSILQVLFYDMHATETLYLQPTAAVTGYHMSVGIDIYDYPGNNGVDGGILLPDPNYYYSSRCAVVFVIDAQDDVLHQTSYLMEAAYQAYSAHIGIKFFVFLHKIDGLSEELKQDILQEVEFRMMKFFGAENFDYTLSFYTTSIYDRSMYEAITQVIGDLVPNKPYIENVLSTFCNTSMMEKAFLFDRDTRICLAGDVLSIDNDAFRFCSDTLLMLEDMFRIMWSEIKDEQMKEEYRRDNPKSKIKPHRGFVTLDGSEYMYAYQVDRSLIMVSVGKDRSTMKDALLEYNAAQTAKGIRKILTRKTTTTPYIDILINDYENKQSGVAEARGYEPPAAPTNPQ